MPTILLKRSNTPGSVPSTANLTNLSGGVEVAVNTADRRMFTMTSASAVVELGTNPSSLTTSNASITVLTGASATITTILDGAGNVRKIPSVGAAKTSVYTLSISDVGEFVTLSTGGGIDVPNDVFSAGDAISVFNNTSSNATISLSVTTAYVSGLDADANSVTLATRGITTVLFINPSLCVLSGSVS